MAVLVFILFIFLIIYGILISFYHRAWNRLPLFVPAETGGEDKVFVSVIIAVRNEASHIRPLIGSLGQQQYPRDLFEVIIVDDHSEDDTWRLLQEASDNEMHLVVLKNNGQSKKKAIEAGIHSARGTLIVATDADCRFSPLWIRTIVSFYLLNDARFIAAPVAMTGARNLAGVFQTLDFLCLQGITAAAVHKRFHMMSNGANLAYEKKAFLEVNGFEGIDKIPTGDDMLLMHKIYSRYPDKVFYLKSQDAIVTTDPEKTWRAFFEQRIRWASKAVYYQDKRIFYVLLLVYLLNAGLGVMAIACIWNASWLFLLILLLLAKTIIEYPFVHSIAAFFQQQRLMKFFAVLQPLHILYIIISGWLGKFGSYTWKNRKLK